MENNQQKKRLKGIYLVPDPLMMKPHFGPSEHIKVGLKELQKYFDIEILVLGDYKFLEIKKNSKISKTNKFGIQNGFIGLLRDIKLLLKSNRNTQQLIDEISQRGGIDFIYERGQYLDFRGIKYAKKLGISHFYEVNWLNFLGIQQFYNSWFNSIARILEVRAYRNATLNFFVGTQHTLINLPKEKVYTIQNGIHEELIQQFSNHSNRIGSKIKICFVANLMPHHRFDILVKALNRSTITDKIELHLIGYYFEKYKGKIPNTLETYFHGAVEKKKLPELLKNYNIGIVTGSPSYSSFMKIFEYAAFKMAVICPDLENIKFMFSGKEMIYFNTDSADSLAEVLTSIINNPEQIFSYGENIYQKVKDKYTWENIYQDIAYQIQCKI